MADNEKTVETQASDSKPVKAKTKKNKPSVFSRMAAWLRSVKSEMKKIVWTSPQAVRSNTIMVLIALIVFAVAIGVLDVIFSKFIYILGILI